MKVAIYSPYLDTFGGGERYMMTIAEAFSKFGDADILLDQNLKNKGDYLKKELSQRFNLDLEKTRFANAPFGSGSNFLSRIFFLKKYDLFFYLTDGSIFIPGAKKNIMHIQSPLVGQPAKSLWGKVKLRAWDLIIYNSNFTKVNSEKNWPLPSKIIHPPVEVRKIKPLEKKNYILSVGRFFGYLKDKKQEILIKTFIYLYKDKKINGWSLHLAGTASDGDEGYLEELKDLAKDYPINFYPNIGFEDLMKLYGQSSIYWHASGFEESDPTKMEHFGISTVEAMAGGCVPVVIGKGGQREIVEDKESGFLWESLDQLQKYTLELIKDTDLREKISKKAIKRSSNFNKEKFVREITSLI